jgi:hypothetical protein
MRVTTILLLTVASAAAQGVYAQNGAGGGPPAPMLPGPTSIVPLIQKPQILPIRIAGVPVAPMEIAIRRERELA